MRTTTRTLALLALVAGTAGACGGDSGPSRDELVAQGDAICQKAVDDTAPLFGSIFPTGNETPDPSVAAPVMTKAAGILEAELADLRALEPPDDDADEWKKITDDFAVAVAEVKKSADLAVKGDKDGYLQALGTANELDGANREDFKALGFTTCAGE